MILSDREMQELIRVDESAMPSTCFVYGSTNATTILGGSSATEAVPKHDKPLRCRLSIGGTAAREREYGGQIQSVVDVVVQISLTDLRKAAIEIDSDDEIVVTSELVMLTGRKMTKSARYKVIGDPSYESYSTSLSVPIALVT